jgi:hypothetical protein
MDYKFVSDLLATAEVPKENIHSQVLQKDDVNITLFGFSAGRSSRLIRLLLRPSSAFLRARRT